MGKGNETKQFIVFCFFFSFSLNPQTFPLRKKKRLTFNTNILYSSRVAFWKGKIWYNPNHNLFELSPISFKRWCAAEKMLPRDFSQLCFPTLGSQPNGNQSGCAAEAQLHSFNFTHGTHLKLKTANIWFQKQRATQTEEKEIIIIIKSSNTAQDS